MKALAKERDRRYETANALSRDIQRYLADEVVEARPPSAGYRLKKLARRHKGEMIAASLVLLTLVAGIVVSTNFAVLAGEEAKAARDAEGHARRSEGDAKQAETKAEDEARAVRKRQVEAKWQERLAHDAHHAIQIDLALRAREKKDYAQMESLLKEMRPEYQSVWETCYIRTLLLRETPLRATLQGHTGSVVSVAFSSDSKRILTGSSDNTARLWDAETGQEMAILKGHSAIVYSVVFSPDGSRVLTGSFDKTARIWDAKTGQEKFTLQGHTEGVRSVAFGPDGKSVITGSDDKTARVWDAETGQEKFVLKGHTDLVWSVAYSPDGRRDHHREYGQDDAGLGRRDRAGAGRPKGTHGQGDLRGVQPRQQARYHW